MPPAKPIHKPGRPFFSSGPTCKIPGWSSASLPGSLAGRSHRSQKGVDALRDLIRRMKALLEIPDDYEVALIPGSATGAVECAMWNFLGSRPVQALAFDVFGARWQDVLKEQLRVEGQEFIGGVESGLPALNDLNFDKDVLFAWNGSTGGLCLPDGKDGSWIPHDRQGLTLCDATSAVFTTYLPWKKLDVTAFSWQKGLGGEAAHGMLVLSPRSVKHLKENESTWPTPFLFCLRRAGRVNAALFEGFTLNTPSLLCVEDAVLAIMWAESLGGLPELVKRTRTNADLILDWCNSRSWIQPLRSDPINRSNSTLCLEIIPPDPMDRESLWIKLHQMRDLVEREQAGYDFLNHARAQPCLRVWCGPTVQSEDIQAFLPWLDYAYEIIFSNS